MSCRAFRARRCSALLSCGGLAAAIAAIGLLALSSTAAAAGKPVNVGSPLSSGPPAIAVDSSGNAVVVWANTQDLSTPNSFRDYLQYCVVKVGTSACLHSGNLIPADAAQRIDGTQVLEDSGTIVILADVYGAALAGGRHYEPEQEWQSTDGGASFNLVNGGLSVASANLNADTGPLNAVIMPGTGVLGYGWETAGGPPTFNAFPLNSPPECSEASPCPFATLEPNSNPDTLGNGGGAIAAQAGAKPGVLGVYTTLFSNGPFGCPSATPNGLAFAYGAGDQSAANDYNVSPGSANSAWTGPVAQGECGVQYFTVAGGPSGFGILANDEAHGRTVYQAFNQTTRTFGSMVTVSHQGELSPALSQDGLGGIYATDMNGGSGGPVVLAYSPDGGKTWSGPVRLDAYNGEANVTSSVNGVGQGWAAWINNGSVFAQSFNAGDAFLAPIVAAKGTRTATTITVTVTCSAFPCTVKVTITERSKAAADVANKHKTKPVVLAKAKFTINKAGPRKLTLKLKSAGKTFFATHPGTVKVNVKVSATFKGVTKTTTRTVQIKHK